MTYVVPILFTLGMGVPFQRRIRSPLKALRDLNIKIVPSKTRIFSTFRDTEPLFIKVENNGGNSHDYTLKIDLPQKVVAEYNGEEYTQNLTKSGTVGPEKQSRYNIDLKYTGDEMRSGLIEAEVSHDAGSIEEDIEVLLVPQ